MKERKLALVNTETNMIESILIYDKNESIQQLIFPNYIITVESTDYDVGVGDSFTPEGFIKNGKVVPYILPVEEEIPNIKSKLEVIQAALDELML